MNSNNFIIKYKFQYYIHHFNLLKKKKMKRIGLFLPIFILIFTNCKKKSDDGTLLIPYETKLLTAHQWFLTDVTANKPVDCNGDGISSTDVYSQMKACDLDDIWLYSITTQNNNLLGTVNEGSNSCFLIPNSSNEFFWSFTSKKTLTTSWIDYYGTLRVVTILELDNETLKVSYETFDENHLSYIRTETYSKTPITPV